jgi:hypothetical protein
LRSWDPKPASSLVTSQWASEQNRPAGYKIDRLGK